MEDQYMRRAIELARQGIGFVNPNPLVGAVIVKDGRVIAEGYHARYGQLHAERHALSRLTEDARGAEMYVTLEPCCHQGKQPPCTQALIEHGIRKVYVGSDDPNELVAGKGIQILRDAGIEVETHVLKEECDALNPVFFHYITTGTPYVVMKYAMTMDGRIACDNGASQWITGPQARQHVQKTRHRLAGIMAGIGTVLADDPMLNCRLEGGSQPVRIICDSHLRLPLTSRLVQTADVYPLTVATICRDEERLEPYRRKGVDIIRTRTDASGEQIDLQDLMENLGQRGIDSVLLEGGGTLNRSALAAGIVSEVQVYIAPKIFGGSGRYCPVTGEGVTSPDQAWMFGKPQITTIGDDVLLTYRTAKCAKEV